MTYPCAGCASLCPSLVWWCLALRIDEIAHLLDTADGPGYVAPAWLSRPQIWEMVHARWQVFSQAGRASLLAADEQAGYGFVYALFADLAADEDREQAAWARLRVLEALQHTISAMRDELRLTLQDARLTNSDIRNLNKLLQSRAAEMNLARQPMPRGQQDTGICLPIDTPRVEALKRLSAAAGHPVEP
jgi:hypothetical protein